MIQVSYSGYTQTIHIQELEEENSLLKSTLLDYMNNYYEMYDGKLMDPEDEKLFEELKKDVR
jgi:hypothetical protein